jgi:hypothetical protein
MQPVAMIKFICLFNAVFLFTGLYAETPMEIPERTFEVLLDGYLEEWVNVPAKVLVPGGEGLRSAGDFAEDDLRVEVKALWDKEYLYLAFDNFKFHIRKSDYDYTAWISPRANDEGPHYWCRLLEGYGGMERATGAPMITARHQGNRVTMEVLLLWKQLRIKPKKNQTIPLRLVVADSDLPGKLLESKVEHIKWVGWMGQIKVVEADR